jgi:hypothetical protein
MTLHRNDSEADRQGRQQGPRACRVHNLAAGRAALTLTPGVGAALKQTLLALRGGVHLAEHHAPGQRHSRSCTAECGW